MIEVTWLDNRERINGLWPTARWTPDEKDLWHRELSDLNQEWLREALDTVAKNYSSKKPTLKWVTEAFRQVKSNNTVAYVPPEDTTDHEAEVMADDRMMRLYLTRQEQGVLKRARQECRIVMGIDVDLDVPVEEWSRTSVGVMYASIIRKAVIERETHA